MTPSMNHDVSHLLRVQDLAASLARAAAEAGQLRMSAQHLHASQAPRKLTRDACVQAESSAGYKPMNSEHQAAAPAWIEPSAGTIELFCVSLWLLVCSASLHLYDIFLHPTASDCAPPMASLRTRTSNAMHQIVFLPQLV